MDKSVRYIKGVGEKRAQSFEKLGVFTVGELVRLLPRRYEDLGNITDIAELSRHRGEKVSVIATVARPVSETRVKGSMLLTNVYAEDLSGSLRIVYFNNKFIKNTLHQGKEYLFYGTVAKTGAATLTNPEIYPADLPVSSQLLPIYPLVSGLSQSFMRKTVKTALEPLQLADPLPSSIVEKYRLCSLDTAIHSIHSPEKWEAVFHARRRLIFEELLYYSLGLRLMRSREKRAAAVTVTATDGAFASLHDFEATPAQKKVISEIHKDLASGIAMNRLLQGDVGSGKTYVAGCCAYSIIRSGAQAVIMAPTEVLANQHYKYFEKTFSQLGIRTQLLTASVPAAKKREIKARLANGEIDFLVATHAVLTDDVSFSRLGLIITDEQHRFGVMQRSALSAKGENAHILVMSATPIPRTLALMLWGDLDLSVLDALPQGRQKISTFLVDTSYYERLDGFIQKTVTEGGRAYVVCPMIEDNEEYDIQSAQSRYKQLCEYLGDDKVGLVHGKLKPSQKDAVMTAFANGEISVLVSTTVIEVGVNVPEATLMVIENAERFGLSQLHQLRGRVGRGSKKSYCILISDSQSESTQERLEYFTKTTDGFKISEKDLELRGPGNLFGKDQHGLPTMQIADMQQDITELQNAADCARMLIEKSPDLNMYPAIRANVMRLFETKGEIFN